MSKADEVLDECNQLRTLNQITQNLLHGGCYEPAASCT
jgi:hypothetical protein